MPGSLQFTYPVFALGVAAAFILGWLVYAFLPRRARSRSGFGPGTYLLRTLTLGLLALSAAGPHLETKKFSNKAYVLVDISESNNEAVMQGSLDRLKEFESAGFSLNILPFAGAAGAPLQGTGLDYAALKNDWANLDVGETNIEEALLSLQSHDAGSILLASDGFETKGGAARGAAVLKQAGYKIFSIVPESSHLAREEFGISNLYAPLIAQQGKSVMVKVSVANRTSSAESGTLELKHADNVILSKKVTIDSAREEIFTAESDPSMAGIREITAVFKPASRSFTETSRTIFLSGEKGDQVLLLSGANEDQRFLRPALESQAYQLKALLPENVAAAGELKEYSAVILNNIAANQLPRGMASNIEAYVEEGGSFIMIGGNRSFGLGGYINSAIETVLPVELLPPQKEEKRLNVAVQLLIDKSRSMADANRIDFAKEAAIEVVDNLKSDDFIGVMGFDVNPFVVIRLAPVSEARAEARRRIGLLYPNKGTSLVASIDEGRRDLMRAKAGRKHMLILTDGEITDAPRHYYFEMIKQVRLLGITVSTVMLGGEGDESMLREMANLGGGAFYRTRDARNLPKIFIADLKVASGERTLKEQSDYAVRRGPAGLLSTSIESYPSLAGYVQTKVKNRADLELVTYADNKAEPLLATWRYGKGKSAAFTSDANGRWSEKWIGWGRFQAFWSDILTSLRGDTGGTQAPIRFDLKNYYQNGALNLDLTVYSEAERPSLEAELFFPDKTSKVISLRSVAPGRYFAAIQEPTAGKYEFHGKFEERKFTPVAFNLSGELLGEIKGKGYNLPLLTNLSVTTGGKINPQVEDLTSLEYVTVKARDLSQLFIIAALVTFLLEILCREVLHVTPSFLRL